MELLRKGNYHWDDVTEAAFEDLKIRLTTTPVLVYPDFTLPFVIETNACGVGVGAILLQNEHPIAFYSKKLSPLREKAASYAKELWAITDAIQKWRHYLCGNEFTIRMDHRNLKNLVEQTIQALE